MARRRKDARTDQTADLTVERVGAQGDGIAQFEGEPVYLPLPCPATGYGLGSARGAAAGARDK